MNRRDLPQPQLKHGSKFTGHEDCLVGNEAGLRNLAKACESALDKGSHYSSELGDYIGVEKLSSDWFEQPQRQPTIGANGLILIAFLVVVSGLAFVGLAAVIRWLF